MDKKLRRLREHMDQTVLKDVDFSDSSKEKVRKAVRAQTDNSSRRPWIYQLKNGLSVAVCLLLLFGGIVYAIQQQNSANTGKQGKMEAAQKNSASKANANSHHNGANHHAKKKAASSKSHASHSTNNKVSNTLNAKNSKNSNSNARSASQNVNPVYLIRMMSSGSGWELSKNNVLHTSTGGQQWSPVKNFGGNPKLTDSAFFLNSNDAWVTAQFSDGTITQFYTTNGGRNWTPSKSKVLPARGMMDFINSQDGWILHKIHQGSMKDSVEIYHTNNSGKTWQPTAITNQLGQLPSSGKVTGIGFARNAAGTGWLSGYEPNTSGQPWLYQTADNGKTWRKDYVPLNSQWKKDQIKTFPPMFFQGGTLLPVTMGDPASGELNHIEFYQQKGSRWSPKGNLPIHSSQVVYDFSNVNYGWVVTDHAVYKTYTGTQYWNSTKAGPRLRKTMANGKAEELDIYSHSTARLLVKMKDGSTRLLITYNGGQTWQPSHP